MGDDIEDFNSPNKVQARKEQKEKDRSNLEKEFFNKIDISIIVNVDESKLPKKDKKNIYSRLTTEYGKNKEGFILNDSLDKVILNESLSLSVGPQKANNGEGFNEFKNRVIEFKEQLLGDILEGNLEKPQEIETETTEISKSTKKTVNNTRNKTENILNNSEKNTYTPEQEANIRENYNKLSEKTINNPKTSVINRLAEAGEISTDTKKIIENNGDLDKNFEETITNKDDLKTIQETLKQIPKNKESVPVDNLTNFKEDYPKLADIAINGIEAKSIKKGEEPKATEILAYEEIAENYIKIGDNPKDKEKNYSAAIKTASANILKENTTIDRDKTAFQEAVNKIHSQNPKEQFEGLVSLIDMKESAETKNAAIGNKLDKRGKKPKLKTKLIDKGNKIHEELIIENNKENKNPKKIEKLTEELEKIKNLLKPKSGDAKIGGSDKDVIDNGNLEKKLQES